MSMQDPIADMLTRIRNAQSVQAPQVEMPASRLKKAILSVLEKEGYIQGSEEIEKDGKKNLRVTLRYYQGKKVIDKIQRVSRPGLRVYRRSDQLPSVLGGMGIAIVSTPQGVMTEKEARAKKLGGEILCVVE